LLYNHVTESASLRHCGLNQNSKLMGLTWFTELETLIFMSGLDGNLERLFQKCLE
jgi:hypothetical protein